MAISVSINNNVPEAVRQDITGVLIRRGSLSISGLTANSANTVPHGLPFIPRRLSYRPQAAGGWNETQAPDGTNIYVTVASSGPTSFVVDYEEG